MINKSVFFFFCLIGVCLNISAQRNINVYYLTTRDFIYIETMREMGGLASVRKIPPNAGKYLVYLDTGKNANLILEFMVDSNLTLCGEEISYTFDGKKIQTYTRHCDCGFSKPAFICPTFEKEK